MAFFADVANDDEYSVTETTMRVEDVDQRWIQLHGQLRRRLAAPLKTTNSVGIAEHEQKRFLQENGDEEGEGEGGTFGGSGLFEDWGVKDIVAAVGIGVVGLVVLCCVCVFWSLCCCCC